MIVLLLEEKMEDSSQTILRFRTFVTWLSLNSVDSDTKEEFLQTFNFEDFTFKELSLDVRKSGLYSTGKIMERLEELYQVQSKELKEDKLELAAKSKKLEISEKSLKSMVSEVEKLKKEKIEQRTSTRNDMATVRNSVNKYYTYAWNTYVPAEIRTKYNLF